MQAQPDGYLAVPDAGRGDPVLVLHAWWGLNDTMKRFCDRLAGAGFIAFAPDLYHGMVAQTIPEAEALGSALDANAEQAKAEVAQAAKFLAERAGADGGGHPGWRMAVIGFSLGAYYAVDLSTADPERVKYVVLFYGTGPADLSRSQAAYLGHFAENDPYEPKEYADELEAALRRAGRPVTFFRYPGVSHWFFESDNPQYDEAAAALAWDRTLAFLNHTSGGDKKDLPGVLISQYMASLEMLKQAIVKCPESLWNRASDKNKTWNIAYHALFFTHLYLGDSEAAFRPWSKHRDLYEDFELPQSVEPYDKDAILEYLAFCQQEVRDRVPRMDLEAAPAMEWKPFSKLELQIYSIRHIMQHTGELLERLGPLAAEIDWVGSMRG